MTKTSGLDVHPDLLWYEQKRLEAATARENAEAEKHSADTDLARLHLREETIRLADLTRENDEFLAQEHRNKVFHFAAVVNSQNVTNCQRTLAQWHRLYPGAAFEIVFNSPGGGVIDGMALFDYFRYLSREGHKITTTCRGYAASMGGILLQAGDHRAMGRESYLMIHEISAGTGGKIGEIQDAVKFYEKICDRVVDIFVDRSNGKCTKKKFVEGWKRQDWWLDSGSALELGFIDEIV